jgi:hypothetical protein
VGALTPASVTLNAGATATFTVAIAPAQPGATSVALSADQPTVLQVPASVSVAQGQTSATFIATALAAGNAVVTASVNGTQQASSVQVLALPSIFGETPKDQTLSGATLPQIAAQYASPGSAIDLASVRLRLDGQDVTSLATVTGSAVFYDVTQPLANAAHTASVSVANTNGGTSSSTWSFTLDEAAPNFYSESPRDVFVADRQPRIRVLLSGFQIVPSSVTIQLDGVDVTAQAEVSTGRIVYLPPAPLADGLHTVSVSAIDGRAVPGNKQWSFTVELPPPPVAGDDGDRTPRTVNPEVRVLQ